MRARAAHSSTDGVVTPRFTRDGGGSPQADEVELLCAAARGERDAVRIVLDRAGPILYGFVFARVGGDEHAAEDVVQDVLVEAMRSAHTFRGDAALSSWLCAIARRRLARHYESERREAVARAGLVAVSGDGSVPAPAERAVDRDRVVRALGRLNPIHRQALILKYLDGLSVAQIASELGRSRTGIQSLLQRAREGLRRELEKLDGP